MGRTCGRFAYGLTPVRASRVSQNQVQISYVPEEDILVSILAVIYLSILDKKKNRMQGSGNDFQGKGRMTSDEHGMQDVCMLIIGSGTLGKKDRKFVC